MSSNAASPGNSMLMMMMIPGTKRGGDSTGSGVQRLVFDFEAATALDDRLCDGVSPRGRG
eukprot:238804-Rhodomonas_salina.1